MPQLVAPVPYYSPPLGVVDLGARAAVHVELQRLGALEAEGVVLPIAIGREYVGDLQLAGARRGLRLGYGRG